MLPTIKSIHADIAYTLGEYLYRKLNPNGKKVEMNIVTLEVLKGLVANKNTKMPQFIRVFATTADINSGTISLHWHNGLPNGTAEEPFASANIHYGDAAEWLTSWVPATHLIQGRIQTLERLAEEGIANRFSHNMAYRLFASNLVDYAEKYRGMRSVVLHELEAFADVVLSTEKGGTWTIPPYFIDSVAHLAGFIMNVSDAVDTKANFCVTPGWSSMRFARPLVAGGKYRSYVKMIPTVQDPTVYLGNVYVLQDDAIIGMVDGIKFRRYPRLLLNRFFSAPDENASKHTATASSAAAPVSPKPTPAPVQVTPKAAALIQAVPSTADLPRAAIPAQGQSPIPVAASVVVKGKDTTSPVNAPPDTDSTAAKAIALIADEAALEPTDLHDEASFANLGVDSLMSLVIAEKFREELGVTVGGSLFLEYPTVGDLRGWLMEYYG